MTTLIRLASRPPGAFGVLPSPQSVFKAHTTTAGAYAVLGRLYLTPLTS